MLSQNTAAVGRCGRGGELGEPCAGKIRAGKRRGRLPHQGLRIVGRRASGTTGGCPEQRDEQDGAQITGRSVRPSACFESNAPGEAWHLARNARRPQERVDATRQGLIIRRSKMKPTFSRTPDETQPGRTRRSRKPGLLAGLLPDRLRHSRKALAVVAAAFSVSLLLSGLLVFLAARQLALAWSTAGFSIFQPLARPTVEGTADPAATGVPSVFATPVPWSGADRVTVLLMGLDYRDWVERRGYPRTDSMMLILVDPITRQVGLLSIPRDLWVEIPGFGHNRIDTAYPSGEVNRLPGGGPGLAMRTVESVVGVPVQYYAVIEFSAFERMIDEIGGIDVLVHERVKISPIGRLSLWLEASRTTWTERRPWHTPACARRPATTSAGPSVSSRWRWPFLIASSGSTWCRYLSLGLRRCTPSCARLITNLSLDQMISLGWTIVQIPKTDYRRGVIGPPKWSASTRCPTASRLCVRCRMKSAPCATSSSPRRAASAMTFPGKELPAAAPHRRPPAGGGRHPARSRRAANRLARPGWLSVPPHWPGSSSW